MGNLQNGKFTTTFYEDREHKQEEESKTSKSTKKEEKIKEKRRIKFNTCSTTTQTYLEEKKINSFLENKCLSTLPICQFNFKYIPPLWPNFAKLRGRGI